MASELPKFDLKKLNIFANPMKMFFPKRMIGVDIGTGSVKIVEVSRWGQGKTLENYGEIKSSSLYAEGAFRDSERGSYLLSNYFIARAVRAVLDEAGIRTKDAIFAVPDFQCFSTSFDLPPMTAKELPDAVQYTAPQFIPLPISETTLDWKLVKGEPGKNVPLRVFLVAIPNQVIDDYQNIAQLAGLQLYAVESEVMGLSRALVAKKDKAYCLVDIGVQTTTISVIYQEQVKKSFSFDFSGGQLTHAVATALRVERQQAEAVKNKEGLISQDKRVKDALFLLIDPLIVEMRKVMADFAAEEGKQVEMVMLAGGSSLLPGLQPYIQATLKKPTAIADCFNNLLYPPVLRDTLKKISPSFSVATGVALGGLET